MAQGRVVNVQSSSSHPLDLGWNILHELDVGLRVKSEFMWKDEWKYVTIVSDHNRHLDMGWEFLVFFYHYRHILWGQSKPTIVLCVSHLILVEDFSHLRNIKAYLVGWDAWVCSKALLCIFSSCFSRYVIKSGSFSSCGEISSCTSRLIKNSNTPMTLGVDVIDLLGLVSIMARISSNKFRSTFFLSERSVWGSQAAVPSLLTLDSSNSLWIFCTVFRLMRKHPEIFVLLFQEWMPCSTLYRFLISGWVHCSVLLLSSQTMHNRL